MESLSVNLDVSAVNPDELHESELNDDTVTVSKQYLNFLERIAPIRENLRNSEEVFAIEINSLKKLLVRPDATNECTKFDKIFYDDIIIGDGDKNYTTEQTMENLINWYLDGCVYINLSRNMSSPRCAGPLFCIFLQNNNCLIWQNNSCLIRQNHIPQLAEK
jgi:hypothetical protein